MSEKIRWNSIDFVKGLACIAVVFIHFNFPSTMGVLVKAACRFGVPVFFFVSGFFLGWSPGGTLDANIICKKIKHIFIILVGASIFYAVFTVFYRWISLGTVEWRAYAAELLTAAKIAKFFVQNDTFLYGHLWFLFGLIYCYSFIMFVPIKKKCYVGILSVVFMIGFLLLTVYHPWFRVVRYIKIPGTDTVFSIFNFFFFRALGFFMLGMYCKSGIVQIRTFKINSKILMLLAIFGCCLSACEGYILGEAQFYIGSYITLSALVVWAIQNPHKGNGVIGYIGRELSLYIYVLHIAVGNMTNLIFNKTSLQKLFFGGGGGISMPAHFLYCLNPL